MQLSRIGNKKIRISPTRIPQTKTRLLLPSSAALGMAMSVSQSTTLFQIEISIFNCRMDFQGILHRHLLPTVDESSCLWWSPDSFSCGTMRLTFFSFKWNVLTTVGWIAADIRGSKNPNSFVDPLAFHLALPAAQLFHFSSEVSLYRRWIAQ